MPLTRARTMMMTSAMLNRLCAAIRDSRPKCSCGAGAGKIAVSTGLIQPNTVTSAISVLMPMTMPGIITAM